MSREAVRFVDRIPDTLQRSGEMEVLCLGLSRTGTMSLYTALNKLGYRCYHYTENRNNKQYDHIRCWLEAMNAKMYGVGNPYGRAEFDKVLANYNAVTDAPCANLAKELVRAYPNAKVVLNTRDVDQWLPSMETSYYDILAWKSLQILAKCQKRYSFHPDLLRLILTDWTCGEWDNRARLREGFIQHYQQVRSLVPEDNLLEHRPQDGWQPLCKFLERPVPNEPYPRMNEGHSVFRLQVTVFLIDILELGMPYAVPVLLAACLVYFLGTGKS